VLFKYFVVLNNERLLDDYIFIVRPRYVVRIPTPVERIKICYVSFRRICLNLLIRNGTRNGIKTVFRQNGRLLGLTTLSRGTRVLVTTRNIFDFVRLYLFL